MATQERSWSIGKRIVKYLLVVLFMFELYSSRPSGVVGEEEGFTKFYERSMVHPEGDFPSPGRRPIV